MNSSKYFKRFLCMALVATLLSIGSVAWTRSAQADTFTCYERDSSEHCAKPKLILEESCGSSSSKFECCEGKKKDFHIDSIDDRNSDVVVLAIHGGLIEPNSDKVSKKLAELNNWNYYNFLGHGSEQCLKGLEDELSENEKNFRRLHITSTYFNHEKALKLVRSHPKSIAIHGYNPDRGYKPGVICVGGKDEDQIDVFINYVNAQSSTFTAFSKSYALQPINAARAKKDLCIDDPQGRDPLRGTNNRNIVNRNSRHKGLQLEFNYDMLADLTKEDVPRFKVLGDIIYGAVEEAMNVNSSS